MSAGCMRLVLSRTVRAACDVSPAHWTSASRFPICSERSNVAPFSRRWPPFSTAVDDTEQTPAPPKKKKPDSRAHGTIGGIGHRIPQRLIHVISDTDENLGTMHRSDVLRIMDEKGLKLVLLNEHKDPPIYKLMSGKQIHEEQLKLREKQKAKAAPVQVKELTFSSGIAAHDLSTKLKQAELWLEKKQHVRITLRRKRGQPADNLDTTLEQMVQQMGVMVGFVSPPKVKGDGQAAVCVLRPPSAKELSKKAKSEAAAAATPNESVSNTDTTEESTQE